MSKGLKEYLPERVIKDYQRGVDLLDQEKPKESERIFRRILSGYDDQNSGIIRCLLAQSCIMERKYKEAVNLLEKLTKEFPDNQQYVILLGSSYENLKKYNKVNKLLTPLLKKLNTCFELFAPIYCEMLDKTGRKKDRVGAVVQIMNDWQKQPLTPADRDYYFPYIGYSLLFRFEIENKNQAEARKVIEGFRNFAASDKTTDRCDDAVAAYVAPLSELANPQKWSRDLFREYLDILSSKTSMKQYPALLSSGYSSVESYDFYENSTDLFPDSYIYSLWFHAGNNQDEISEIEVKWHFARLSKDYPDDIRRCIETYPHYWNRISPYLLESLHDPDRTMQKAVHEEAQLTGASMTDVQNELERIYQNNLNAGRHASKQQADHAQ